MFHINKQYRTFYFLSCTKLSYIPTYKIRTAQLFEMTFEKMIIFLNQV